MAASVTIIVGRTQYNASSRFEINPGMASDKPWQAFVASNPQLRSSGRTEQEAIDRLKKVIMYVTDNMEIGTARVVDLVLDDLVVAEVHNS
jgi:predicted RNase H-like HicB family nuclease